MRKRPWPIVLLASLQIVTEPVSNFLLTANWNGLTPEAHLRSFISNREWSSIFFVFGLPLVMGVAVFAMKRWSFALFAACACWVLYRNYALIAGDHLSVGLVVLIFVSNLGFVAYFLLPAVASPYLNPKLRWWETRPRFAVDLLGRLDFGSMGTFPCRLQNVSTSGALVHCAAPLRIKSAPIDSIGYIRVGIPTDLGSQICIFKARVAFTRITRLNAINYGLEFQEMSDSTRLTLFQLVRRLKKKGYRVARKDTTWEDLRSGCFALIRGARGVFPGRSQRNVTSSPESASEASGRDLSRDGT